MHPLPIVSALALLLAACNAPPEGGVASLELVAPTTVDDLVLTISQDATDPDDHTITYGITWTRNGAADAELTGEYIVPAEQTTKGQVWEATILPVDEKAVAGTPFTASITIENTTPTAV